jgi:hypothetical protein
MENQEPMTKEALANLMNGRVYGFELSMEEAAAAKKLIDSVNFKIDNYAVW